MRRYFHHTHTPREELEGDCTFLIGKLFSSHELSPIAFSANDCFTFFSMRLCVWACVCLCARIASILLIGIRVDFHFRDESHFIVIIFIGIWIIFGVIFFFCIEITWWKSEIISTANHQTTRNAFRMKIWNYYGKICAKWKKKKNANVWNRVKCLNDTHVSNDSITTVTLNVHQFIRRYFFHQAIHYTLFFHHSRWYEPKSRYVTCSILS